MHSALDAAYRATHYRVDADPPFVLRVGERSAELDALLESRAIAAWRYSVISAPGIRITASMMPSGTISTSSKYPSTGMKSGMRSIGPSA